MKKTVFVIIAIIIGIIAILLLMYFSKESNSNINILQNNSIDNQSQNSVENQETNSVLKGVSAQNFETEFKLAQHDNMVSPYDLSRGIVEPTGIIAENTDNLTNYNPNKTAIVNGVAYTLTVPIYDENINSLDIGSIPLIVWQVFEKSCINNDSKLSVNNALYNLNDLDKFKLFENEKIVVYDITQQLYDYETYKTFINTLGYEQNLKDLIWALELQNYYFDNFELLLG